ERELEWEQWENELSMGNLEEIEEMERKMEALKFRVLMTGPDGDENFVKVMRGSDLRDEWAEVTRKVEAWMKKKAKKAEKSKVQGVGGRGSKVQESTEAESKVQGSKVQSRGSAGVKRAGGGGEGVAAKQSGGDDAAVVRGNPSKSEE